MFQFTIKEGDKAVFSRERYEHIHPRVCQRMDALHLKSKGLSNKHICIILDICSNTLSGYFRMYIAGGVDELRKLKFNRPQSQLVAYKGSLEKYFTENPPSSISVAAAKIKELTGIDRKETQVRKFLKSLGFRCLQVGVVPAKALTEEKKPNKRNIWTKNFSLD
jgi:phenylalanyl-tRNA synthetase beta subunit